MAASDRDDALDRLINAALGEAVPGETALGDPDLKELARLAQALRASGREHAREVDGAAGWARLAASIAQTPQVRPYGRFGWLRLSGWTQGSAWAEQSRFAPFPVVASAAVILGISLLLAMPDDSASAALLRDVDAIERTVAAASAAGTLSEDDRVTLEATASAVLSLVANDDTLREIPAAQVEAIVARLYDARRTLSSLPESSASPAVSALVSLSAASGLVESSLAVHSAQAPAATAAPPNAAAATAATTATSRSARNADGVGTSSTPTLATTATPTPTLTPPTARSREGPDASSTPASSSGSNNRGTGDNERDGKDAANSDATPASRATPVATPGVATLLNTVNPVCGAVYDASTLAACRKAVDAVLLWCDQLASEGARGCASTVNAALQAAERRVDSLSDGCKRLESSRSQQACRDSIEKTSERLKTSLKPSDRPSRGNSGNTGTGDRWD